MKSFKNENDNDNCDDKWMISFKKNHMWCWCDKISMCFSTSLLFDRNVVSHDQKWWDETLWQECAWIWWQSFIDHIWFIQSIRSFSVTKTKNQK